MLQKDMVRALHETERHMAPPTNEGEGDEENGFVVGFDCLGCALGERGGSGGYLPCWG